MRLLTAIALSALLLSPALVEARGDSRHTRSQKTKYQFKKQNPCPSTGKNSGGCPRYVIDHITPLKRGGADTPGNMQWQTKEAAKAKDKLE